MISATGARNKTATGARNKTTTGARNKTYTLCFVRIPQPSNPLESGDTEQNGYWSYNRPFFPTQIQKEKQNKQNKKNGLGMRLVAYASNPRKLIHKNYFEQSLEQ